MQNDEKNDSKNIRYGIIAGLGMFLIILCLTQGPIGNFMHGPTGRAIGIFYLILTGIFLLKSER